MDSRYAAKADVAPRHINTGNFPMVEAKKWSWTVASDVSDRDGIGIELEIDGEMVLEIFRDDTKKAREVTLYQRDVPLSVVEESIVRFKKEIPWDFQD